MRFQIIVTLTKNFFSCFILETKSKLEQEQKVHQETKSLLDVEKASHQETQIKLDQEKKAHGQTQSRLESEETKNKESQELLDAERNTFHQIQVQHLQQLHQQEQFRQETQSVLNEVRGTNRQFQSQLDEKQAKMSLKKQEQKVEDKIQSLSEEEDRIHQEIQLDVGKGHEIQSDDSFLNDARKIHKKALLHLGEKCCTLLETQVDFFIIVYVDITISTLPFVFEIEMTTILQSV